VIRALNLLFGLRMSGLLDLRLRIDLLAFGFTRLSSNDVAASDAPIACTMNKNVCILDEDECLIK